VHPCHVCHDYNQYETEEDKEDDPDDFTPLKKQESFDFFGIFRETLQERIDSLSTGM
jgi:hypothetical protein